MGKDRHEEEEKPAEDAGFSGKNEQMSNGIGRYFCEVICLGR